MIKEDLRRFPRVLVKVLVDLESSELIRLLVDYPDSEAYLFDYSTNFSEGGIFIKTRKSFEIGKQIEFSFSFPDSPKVLHVKGKVVWKNTGEGPIKELGEGVGIEFIGMDEETRSQITNFIKTQSKI